MLFAYQYVNHNMEKMHEFINYIFHEVWCKASTSSYSLDLYDGKPELKEVIYKFHYSSTKGGDFFNAKIEEIYLIFKTLKSQEIDQLKLWYQSNNNIEDLCKNNPTFTPSTYSTISQWNADLAGALKSFFSKLYSQDLLSLKDLADKIGYIDDHYNEFVKINSNGKCPFCGLHDIDSEDVHTREAYDHYLPKSKYPFSSINFKNLAPICYKCNSGNKGSKDPLQDKSGNRIKAFYPYDSIPNIIEIDLKINSEDISNLKTQDISINFGPPSLKEELVTWDYLFDIKQRYKSKCCSKDAKYWITQIFDECQDKSPSEFLSVKLETAGYSPFADNNFLRKPFLEACDALSIFSTEEA